MNKIIFYGMILIFCLFISLLYYGEVLYKEVETESITLRRANDSLQSELFMNQTIVDRYVLTLDMLKCDDSIAAQKFEKILYTETE